MKKWYKVEFYTELDDEVVKNIKLLEEYITKAEHLSDFTVWDYDKVITHLKLEEGIGKTEVKQNDEDANQW